MCDFHCHSVPYVDDGAEDIEEAKKIIESEYRQGVRLVVMTVHLRYGMFDTPIERVRESFYKIQKWLNESKMAEMKIFLSREYYCDERLESLLDGYKNGFEEIIYHGKRYHPYDEILPIGSKKGILLEFSSNSMQENEFEIFVKKASYAGLTPIIAHVERYPVVQNNPSIVKNMKENGAYIQVNSNSVLSKASKKEIETTKFLIKNQMVDIISSDAHDVIDRPVNLKKCYGALRKKYGKSIADKLLRDNAYSLIYEIS